MTRTFFNRGSALLILFLALGFFACEHDPVEVTPMTENCDTDNVSFSATVAPLIQTNCNIPGCHVPGGTGNGMFAGPNMTVDYNGVKAKVDNGSFKNRVIDQQNMPPAGGLSQCELDQLQKWLNDGAPNN